MNREILYRAYHKERKIMYDVEVIDFPNGVVTLHSPGAEWFDCLMDEVEMLEYTGLKDKNGDPIYEGNIIKYREINWGYCEIDAPNEPKFHFYTDKVVFEQGEFKASKSDMGWEGEDLIDLTDSEVIGNEHENPELLDASVDRTTKEKKGEV